MLSTTPAGSADCAPVLQSDPSSTAGAVVVPRRLLSAEEAMATMVDYAPGFCPPWSKQLVAPKRQSAPAAALIRSLDVLFALSGLVVFGPLILILAILLRLDSAGPVIFRQTRLGKDLKPFTLYKFRTMMVDSRERFPELYEFDYSSDEVQTLRFRFDDDPRLTRMGRWLRKTGLDQLPNLVNVVKGDVTMVGPRPEVPEMFRHYESWQCMKWHVKPGVTGYAQIQGRGRCLTLQEAIYWDVRYVLERSVPVYFRVLARTVRAVGRGTGAMRGA